MSALLNSDERALRDAVRSYLDKKVAPLVAAHERARTFPWELLPQLYDFGYVRGGVPEAAAAITSAVKDGIGVTVETVIVDPYTLERSVGKLQRVTDLRGTG